MVRAVHFEVSAKEDDAVILDSGMYDLDEYSETRRRSKPGDMVTDNDDSSTEQASVVDAKENPTQLYLRINYRLWDMVLSSLKSKPEEAKIWIAKKKHKALPIHLSCESTSCPSNILEALMVAYPESLSKFTSKGSLPLHLACSNEHWVVDSPSLLTKMVDMYPQALFTLDQNDLTPLEILNNHPKKIRKQCKGLMNKFQEKMDILDNTKLADSGVIVTEEQLQEDKKEQEKVVTPRSSNKREISSPHLEIDTCFVQSPSMEDDGIASQLNRMRMGITSLRYKSPPSKDQIVVATRIQEDERESSRQSPRQLSRAGDDVRHLASPTRKQDDEELSDPEEIEVVLPQCFSADLEHRNYSGSPRSEKSAADLKMRLGKSSRENALLRKKMMQLSEENAELRSNDEISKSLMQDLKQSVERERAFSKTNSTDFETKIRQLETQLVETGRKLQSKTKSELVMAKRISQLEATMAGKKADLSTVRAALQDEFVSKASVEEDLAIQRRDNQALAKELATSAKENETLVNQLEDVTKELETLKEIEGANKKKMKEMMDAFNQKEIHCRSLTGTVAANEAKIEKVEKLNEALKSKTNDLKDALRANTDSFKDTIAKLEAQLQKKEQEEQDTLQRVEELKKVFEAKDQQIENLKSEKYVLEATCESLRQKEVEAEGVAKQLGETSQECGELKSTVAVKDSEIKRLSQEVADLCSESASKSEKIDEQDRRLDALYTELVSQQRRESELDQKNKALTRRFEELTHEQHSKATKLKVLKTAIESYKSEMERIVHQKSNDDKLAIENARRLLDAQERLGAETVKVSELKSKLDASEERERDASSRADKFEKQFHEASVQYEEATRTADELCCQLEEIQQELSKKKERIDELEINIQKLVEKTETLEGDRNELRALCNQREKEASELREECNKVREYNRLQASLVEDLEMTLGELRSKHNSLTDEYEKVKRLAEKRGDLSGGEQLKGLDSARSRVKELEEYVFELKEAKKNETERVRELEVVINDLRGWYSSALARVSELEKKQNSGDAHSLASTNTQQDVTRLQQIISTMKEEALTSETTIKDLKKSHGELEDQIKRLRGRFECTGDDMDAIELLTRINCENLLRIEMLSEREAFSNNSFQENQLKLQQNEEEWEERVMALKETLAEMQASYDSVKKELTEKKKANTELKVELESFKESTRKATLKLKTYGDKIETLENTICQLRGTLEEQNEVIELRVSMSGELAEERELLRKRLSAATKDLERARAKCEKLESNISKLEDEKECLAMRLKSTEVKSESLEVINESLQKLRKTENDIVQATEGSSQWQVEQKKMLEKIDALSQTFRKYGTEGSYENESQSSEPSKVQKDLEHYQAEFERSEELNKSYQIEVGRLLKTNTALKEECQQIRFQIDDQKKQVEDLRRLKESYERQSFESSMKLLDILTQFSPESAVSELRQEKERLQQEYDRMSEDNMANSAHVEYLVKNIELLEDRVTDLTCTHKMMKDEAEGLQDTITRQSDRIVDLENLIKRLQNGDEEAKQEPHISPNPSFEWEKQLMDIVSRFTGDDKSDHESLLQKASDRTAVRETLRKQVKDAFEHQSDKIQKLSNNVKTTESLAADAQKQLEALKAANQTILLENKILKTAGKERDQRAQKLQSKLAAENDSLKQAIAKLTRQTAEHQQKIRKLAAKQASLKRKKEAAKQENTAEALREIKSLSANEDQGSLAFSADSDDATTTTNNQSNGGDKSVEVVLVEGESRDDGQS